MCGYQCNTWECRGDGFLWDADNDGYHPDEFDHPCPKCNTLEFLKAAKEDAETSSFRSQGFGAHRQAWTGAEWWRMQVAAARRINPEAARAAEVALSPVLALIPANNPDGYAVEAIAA